MSDALFPPEDTIEIRVLRPNGRGAYEWPLAAALIWIVYRDVDRADRTWDAFLESGDHEVLLWSDTDLASSACSPAEADYLLLEGLRAGDIRAYGQVAGQEPIPIPPYRWAALLFENSIPQAPDGYLTPNVLAADMKRLFPAVSGKSSAFTPIGREPIVKKMGRPTKYDWASAAGFMAGYIDDKDPQRGDMVKALSAWFKSKNQEPHDSEIEKFVTEAFKAMRRLRR